MRVRPYFLLSQDLWKSFNIKKGDILRDIWYFLADRPSFEEISRRWVNLVDIERRHLPTFDEKWSTNSTSVGYHVSKSVDNEMYFNEGELCS